MSETIIRKAFQLMTKEEQIKFMIWVGELEIIRGGGRHPQNNSEKKLIKRTDEEHKLFINAVLMQIIEDRYLNKFIAQRYKEQITLARKKQPSYKAKQGIISMFEKAMVLFHPSDAVSYYLNKRGRKNKYGKFLGFVITEIPTDLRAAVQPVTVYIVKEPAIERRKEMMAVRRRRKITKSYFNKYLKHNTLIDFSNPDFEPITPKERSMNRQKRIRKKMEEDEEYEIIDDTYGVNSG